MTILSDVTAASQERRSERDQEAHEGFRNNFDRDRARIVHSFAFRRLQAKTQVLGIGEGDFHRTRLTHSMEVANIGRGIVHKILDDPKARDTAKLDVDLIEAIAFAHDLGHPPFGHSGEIALNYAMRESGGFEGNGQTLRILSTLEPRTHAYGLDLTRRTLLGVLKYPAKYGSVRRLELPRIPESGAKLIASEWKPPKCYLDTEKEVVEWLLEPADGSERERFFDSSEPGKEQHGKSSRKSLDCSIMDLADEIAYGTHDLEDCIELRIVKEDQFASELKDKLDTAWAKEHELTSIAERLFSMENSSLRKEAVSSLVRALVASTTLVKDDAGGCPLLFDKVSLHEEARVLLDGLIDLIKKYVLSARQVQTLEYRGRQMLVAIFGAIQCEPEKLLPDTHVKRLESDPSERVICDYIAGMTDGFAMRMYERLFLPRAGSLFERI